MINLLMNIGLTSTAMGAIFFLSFKDPKISRWGYAIGLGSEVFWFWMAWKTGEWGLWLLCFWYLVFWGRGTWNHILRGE